MKISSLRRFAVAAALALAIGVLSAGSAQAEHNQANSPEQTEIERAVHKYLLDHPEVLIEVLGVLRERERATEAERARASIAAHREELVNDPASPVAGNSDGDVTLVEFFDYHCAYCKRVLKDVMTMLDDDPGLRIVFKEFPILGPDSIVASRAALASRNQDPDKYLEFHNALMSTRGRLTQSRILALARDVGFDAERLLTDMDSPEVTAAIKRNLALAASLGINGTPTFVIGDQLIPGAIDLDALKKLVTLARSS
jgi:protein-disulfide isomerase